MGAALALEPADHIFGSHRSHGEFIAKGLSAIAQLPEAALQRIMESHRGGTLLRMVEAQLPATAVTSTAENFLLSFSLPNFYFHATTAYDILRHKGVPLGKRDFTGKLRLKS